MREMLLSPEFVGMKEALADTVLRVEHSYELNHISVEGTEGVAISTIAWTWSDTLEGEQIEMGHQSMWLVRRIEGEWKFVGSVAPISAYREETPLQN
jgi:hypothetical protein